MTLVTLFARLVGGALGVRESALETMLGGYRDVLFDDVYRPEFIKLQRRRNKLLREKKSKKKLEDETLLKKLEGLTEPESVNKPANPRARKK